MLSKLALALSVLIVVLLAVVAGVTVLNPSDDSDQDQGTGNVSGGALDSSVAPGPSSGRIELGAADQPLAVACQLPVVGQTPLLVVFENRTGSTDDFLAQVLVVYNDGTRIEAVASADAVRPGEQRSVVPDPWFESATVVDCRLQVIQQGQRVVLLEDVGP